MRTPGRRRARPQSLATHPKLGDLEAWADSVLYVGSPEHKTYPSFAGQPKLRSDATPCPKELNNADAIREWLREAILRGNVSAYRDKGTYPRYLWDKRQGRWFEARLVNSASGSYKGYPVTEESVPHELLEQVS